MLSFRFIYTLTIIIYIYESKRLKRRLSQVSAYISYKQGYGFGYLRNKNTSKTYLFLRGAKLDCILISEITLKVGVSRGTLVI